MLSRDVLRIVAVFSERHHESIITRNAYQKYMHIHHCFVLLLHLCIGYYWYHSHCITHHHHPLQHILLPFHVIMHQYGIKKEFFVCSIAYHLALMLPQFILQTIYYQKTTDYGNNIVNVLYWTNMLVFMFYVITVGLTIQNRLAHYGN
eukprot:681167_1